MSNLSPPQKKPRTSASVPKLNFLKRTPSKPHPSPLQPHPCPLQHFQIPFTKPSSSRLDYNDPEVRFRIRNPPFPLQPQPQPLQPPLPTLPPSTSRSHQPRPTGEIFIANSPKIFGASGGVGVMGGNPNHTGTHRGKRDIVALRYEK